jgi:hypothetical protein
MAMASLAVIIIILGCAAYQYFKGTLITAVATILIALCAGIAAFGFFEPLANIFISRGDASKFLPIVPWAQPLCFALLFIIVFGALQTGMIFLNQNRKVDFGLLPERIGRVIAGILLGLLISGYLLTALGMAPLPQKIPYQRFDDGRNKVLLNPDGFVAGIFSIASRGGLSGKKSFAALHPNFIDQIHLNRMVSGTSILTSKTPAITLPKPTEPAVWPAPDSLNQQISELVADLNRQGKLKDDVTGKLMPMPAPPGTDYRPMIARIGINSRALSLKPKISAGTFTLAQLKLICKRQGYGDNPLSGTGINVYPIGHMKAEDQIQTSTQIKLDRKDDFKNNAKQKWIDFVFCIPSSYDPVLVAFKQNNILAIPDRSVVTADKAPPPVFYNQSK